MSASHPLSCVARDDARRAPLDSLRLQAEYLEISRSLEGDVASRSVADGILMERGAYYHEGPVQWSFIPKVFSRSDISYLAWIAETMGRIMNKVTEAYARDRRIRDFFGFSSEVEELCLAPVPYEEPIPIARVDIFLNEETGEFQFCELNTDGSSGMLATSEVTYANLRTRTGFEFSRRHAVTSFDIYGACVNAVLSAYRAAGGARERPAIAAVDFSESIAVHEIERFRAEFEARGASLRFSDLRDLSYRDGVLSDSQGPIDCVWRRVVVSDMELKPCNGVEAFAACARDGRVPIVGAFRTWPCATKTVFALFHDPLIEEVLDPEEVAFVREHVPETFMLDGSSDLSRFRQRERWIAKPRDGFNGLGVRAGSECTEEEWSETLEHMARTGGTVQAYAPQFYSVNFEGGAGAVGQEEARYSNMEGLYLFDGAFAGVFTRCGATAVIGEHTGRLNMGCLVVDE